MSIWSTCPKLPFFIGAANIFHNCSFIEINWDFCSFPHCLGLYGRLWLREMDKLVRGATLSKSCLLWLFIGIYSEKKGVTFEEQILPFYTRPLFWRGSDYRKANMNSHMLSPFEKCRYCAKCIHSPPKLRIFNRNLENIVSFWFVLHPLLFICFSLC